MSLKCLLIIPCLFLYGTEARDGSASEGVQTNDQVGDNSADVVQNKVQRNEDPRNVILGILTQACDAMNTGSLEACVNTLDALFPEYIDCEFISWQLFQRFNWLKLKKDNKQERAKELVKYKVIYDCVSNFLGKKGIKFEIGRVSKINNNMWNITTKIMLQNGELFSTVDWKVSDRTGAWLVIGLKFKSPTSTEAPVDAVELMKSGFLGEIQRIGLDKFMENLERDFGSAPIITEKLQQNANKETK